MNPAQDAVTAEPTPHLPPTIERLGTLSELTQGTFGADVVFLALS